MTTLRQAGALAGTGATRVRTALNREPSSEALAAALLSTPTLAVVLLLVTWPLASLVAVGGPDGSWMTALYLGLEEGLRFGHGFVFTYGPLGFLHDPTLVGEDLFLVAFAYSAAIRFVLVASLLWTARRALPLPLAVAVCYLVLAVGHLNSALPLVAFLWAWAALAPDAPRFVPQVLVYGGSLAAALELLGKINFGVTILALCLLALAALPGRRRNLPLFGAVFCGSVLVLWLATGQALGDLPAYVSNALQMVAGYSQAMGVDVSPRPGEIPLALAAIVVLLGTALLVTRGDRRSLRWGSVALLLLFAFLCFKQDFIRSGVEGRNDFALMMAAAALAVAARWRSRPAASRCAVAAVALGSTLALVVWANPQPSFVAALEPQPHAQFLSDSLELATDPTLRHGQRESSRAVLRESYAVSPAILGRIGDRSVAIEPWEISAAWAYGMDWKPLPVIQDYAAYTSDLDGLNAAALEGDGPELILRQDLRGAEAAAVEVVDARYPAWDGPGAKLALLCNYGEVLTAGEWQLLERTGDRCGPVGSLGSVASATGSPIAVPAPPHPGEIVFARVHGLEPDLGEEIETLAYRRPQTWVRFDGGRQWNVAAPTAEDGLILSAAARFDYARPFQLAPNAKHLEFGIDGAGSRPLTISFYSRRVRSQRAATSRPPRATTAKR